MVFPWTVNSKLEVCAVQGTELASLVQNLPSVATGSVQLDWWLSWPHLSTVYSSLANFEKVDHIYYRRHTLEHEDGGNNTLDFAVRSNKHLSEAQYEDSGDRSLPPRTSHMSAAESREIGSVEAGVLVVLAHGLSGGSHENYIRRTITQLFDTFPEEDEQVTVVAFNARGCARSKVTSEKYWSALQTDDLAVALDYLHGKYPKKKIVAVGYSLGANILVNYLARFGSDSKISLSVSVSNPWDLYASSVNLESYPLGRLYSKKMTQGLQRLFNRNASMLTRGRDDIDRTHVMAAKSLKEFDGRYTAKVFGFESADEYYIAASSCSKLKQVKTNLVILNAKDDPMALDAVLPYKQVTANRYLCMVCTANGGHIGWYGPNGKRWYADVIVQLVQRALTQEI